MNQIRNNNHYQASLLSPQTWLRFFWSNQSLTELSKKANEAAIAKFIAEYGPVHPIFFSVSFDDLLRPSSYVDQKHLIVYIHSASHQDTPAFCQNVLCNDNIVEYISENFLFWLGDVETTDGTRMSRNLNVTTFPTVAIFRYSQRARQLILADSFVGFVDENEFLVKLMNVVDVEDEPEEDPQLSPSQILQHAEDRMLREEQNRDYEQSLAADREKERERQLQIEEEQRRAKEEEEERIRQQNQELQKEQLLEAKKARLPPPPTSGDIINLAFQLPNGKRLKRSFLFSDLVQVLYDFVDTQPENEEGLLEEYELITNYPKKSFSDKTVTIKEAQIPPNSLLFPQEL